MAIPPPHFGDQPYDPNDAPLTENLFTIGGISVGYLSPFEVFDDATGRRCRVRVSVDTREIVAERWKDAELKPPGSVQHHSDVKVWFAPAVPGRVYRFVCGGGTERRRYEGEPVAKDTLPMSKAEQRRRRQVRLGIAGGLAVCLVLGAVLYLLR